MTIALRSFLRTSAVTLLACLAIIASGCESAPKAGSMKQAVDDYNSQRFAQSQEKAAAIQSASTSGDREDAAYLAGLSAYQLGNLDEAERRLLVAAGSPKAETAAKSKAMLGQIRMDQRRPRDAAAYFSAAAPGLTGEDARKCAYNAAVAYQQAGDSAAAKQWVAKSGGSASSGAVSTSLSPSAASSAKGFTLQVGAFREKNRAQQAAQSAQTLASRDGLGSVKIISRRDERGSPLYLVQVGLFQTRDAAAAARTRLGRLDYIVAPASAS